MSSTKKDSQTSPFVIFDIGSASVGAAIVLVPSEEQMPKIIYDTRTPIVSRDPKNYARLLSSMLSAFKNATVEIEQDGARKLLDNKLSMKDIKNVFCVCYRLSVPHKKIVVIYFHIPAGWVLHFFRRGNAH